MVNRGRDLGTFDLYLDYSSNKVGLILNRDEGGNLRWWPGTAPLSAPQRHTGTFSYEQGLNDIDTPVPFEVFNSAGIIDGGDGPFTGYHFSQGVDASYRTRLYVSPLQNAHLENDQSAIAAAPSKFYRSSLGVFMLAGAYIYEFDTGNDEWIERDDASGDGASYIDIIEMDGTLVATRGAGQDYKYSTNGTSWAAFTDSATGDNPEYLAVRGVASSQAIMWQVASNGLLLNSNDPKNGGSAWGGGDAVGHTSETVNGMVEANDDMYIFTTGGFYRYTGSAQEDVWLGGRHMYRSDNGKQPFVWVDGRIYVIYGDGILQYSPNGDNLNGVELDFVFPPKFMEGNEEVNGTVTAIAGDSFWLYVALKNAAGRTYIMRGNPYGNGGIGEWHTWAYLGANDCNALMVAGPGDVHDNNPTLLFGVATAGSSFILTRPNLRPEDDSNYRFDTATGKIVVSYTDVGARAFAKFLNAGRVVVENSTAGRPVVLKYEIDESGSEVTIVTATSNGESNANISTDVQFQRIRPIFTLDTNDNTSAPVCLGGIFNTTPNPPRKRIWDFEVVVGDNLQASTGQRTRLSGKDLESFLFGALEQRATLYDRRGRSFTVRVLDIRGVGAEPSQVNDTEAVRMLLGEIGT